MKNKEKVIEFLNNNNGYITTADFLKLGIGKMLISNYITSGLIRKVDFGLYMDANLIEDQYFIIQKKYPSAIFSYNTAFHILNLTNRVPYEVDITIKSDQRIRGDYNVHYVSDKKYEVGIINAISPCGNVVKVYNAERSICDMLKGDGQFDLELQNRILANYFNGRNKDIDKLLEYAKIFNIYDKVNTIVEVMMKW